MIPLPCLRPVWGWRWPRYFSFWGTDTGAAIAETAGGARDTSGQEFLRPATMVETLERRSRGLVLFSSVIWVRTHSEARL